MNWKGILILLGILAIIGTLTFGMRIQNQQLATMVAALEAQSSDNVTHTKQLQSEISQVRTQIDQQSALISRVLGDVVPIPVPDDIERGLSALENRLESPSTWPNDQASVEIQFNSLGALMADVPTWVQDEMFPRIVPIRWGLDALWHLRASSDTEDSRPELLENLRSVDRSRPRGAPRAIVEHVTARIGEIEAAITKADEIVAAQTVEAGLSDEATLEQMFAALDILADRTDNPPSRDAETIEQNIAIRSFKDAFEQLETEFSRALELADEELRIAALMRVSEGFMDLQLRMATASNDDAILGEHISRTSLSRDAQGLGQRISDAVGEIQRAAEAKRAENRRSYQIWALERIRNVRPYADILEIELQKIPSMIDRNNPAGEARIDAVKDAQQMLRKEMVDNLSTIDAGLLDVAVGEWFRKVYADRFDALSDKEEQLELVRGFANSTKVGIGEH